MRKGTIGVVVAGLVLAGLVGCGAAAEKAAEEATERAIEDQTGGSAEVDLDDGSISVEGEDGGFEAGAGQVPDEWPDDVPLPDSLAVSGGLFSSSAGQDIVTVSGSSDLTADEVVDEFRELLPGWEVEADGSQASSGGTFASVVFVNGERRLSVGAAGGADAGTQVNLGHTAPTP